MPPLPRFGVSEHGVCPGFKAIERGKIDDQPWDFGLANFQTNRSRHQRVDVNICEPIKH